MNPWSSVSPAGSPPICSPPICSNTLPISGRFRPPSAATTGAAGNEHGSPLEAGVRLRVRRGLMASDPLRQYQGTTCYHLCPLLPVIRLRGKGVHNGWEGGRRRKLVRGETSVIGSLCCAGAHSMSSCSR